MDSTTIILIIFSLLIVAATIYQIITFKHHHPDNHKIHKEPLYYIDGEFMNTHQRSLHLMDKFLAEPGSEEFINKTLNEIENGNKN